MSGVMLTVLIGAAIGYWLVRRNTRETNRETESEPPVVRTVRTVPERLDIAPVDLQDVIDAGNKALASLKAAKEKLNSARVWGMADIMGGGLIVGAVKHVNIRKANEWMDAANEDLRRFTSELRDVADEEFQVRNGDLLSFLDLFCDNFFSDFLMQNRINEARGRIDRVIDRVQNTVWDLQAMKHSTNARRSAFAASDARGPILDQPEEAETDPYAENRRMRYR